MSWWGINHCGQSRLVRRDSNQGLEAPGKQAKGTVTQKAANSLPSSPKKSSETSQGVGRLEPIYFNIKRQHDFRKLKELVGSQGRTSIWLKLKFICFFHWNNPWRVAEYAIQKYAILAYWLSGRQLKRCRYKKSSQSWPSSYFLKAGPNFVRIFSLPSLPRKTKVNHWRQL